MKRIKVYIAGPYSKPDPCENTHEALTVADRVWSFGMVPFVPHLTHFWHTMSPKPYVDWLAYDMHWLEVCDVVLRIPGASSGADAQVAHAKSLGIPVVYSVDDLYWKELPR